MGERITVPDVRARKGGPKLVMVTAYDYPGARMADEASVDIILVGDSLGNAVHGFDDTLQVTLDMMVLHTAAAHRAHPGALLVADMPWMSFHVSPEDTVRNAARLVREGGAEAVKMEGGRKRVPAIEKVLDAEIPVMGHLGLTPQSVHAMGGFKVQGKALEAARAMIEDAKALEAAGIFALVLEGVPSLLAEIITKEISVPTIGIGAGAATDGQVLVFHDLLGIGYGRYPKFVRTYADLRTETVAALRRYTEDVQVGAFPSAAETYHMSDEVADALLREDPSAASSPH